MIFNSKIGNPRGGQGDLEKCAYLMENILATPVEYLYCLRKFFLLFIFIFCFVSSCCCKLFANLLHKSMAWKVWQIFCFYVIVERWTLLHKNGVYFGGQKNQQSGEQTVVYLCQVNRTGPSQHVNANILPFLRPLWIHSKDRLVNKKRRI